MMHFPYRYTYWNSICGAKKDIILSPSKAFEIKTHLPENTILNNFLIILQQK